MLIIIDLPKNIKNLLLVNPISQKPSILEILCQIVLLLQILTHIFSFPALLNLKQN